MFKGKRLISSLVLMGVLAAPVAVTTRALAQEDHHDQQRDQDKRYYDERRHEDHHWDATEDAAYRHWLEQRHMKYVEWEKLSARDRQRYWDWRHDNPNWKP
jgi:Ni/Co efflux regulator RcnB